MLIQRYILREVLATSTSALVLLATVFAAWSAASLLAEAVNGRFAGSVVLQLLALRTLIAGEVLVPTAMFVGTVWTYARLDRDAELPALHAAGIPPRRILLPAVWAGLGAAVLVALLTLALRPWAYQESYRLEEALVPTDIASLETGRFHQWGEGLTFWAGDANRGEGRLGDVFAERTLLVDGLADGVQVVRAAALAVTPLGEQAAQEAGFAAGLDVRRLQFSNGRAWQLRDSPAGSSGERSYRFGTMSFTAALPGSDGVRNQRRARTTLDLVGDPGGKEQAELQWRSMLGPLTLGMVVLAAVLGHGQPRTPVYPRLLAAAAVFVLLFVLASAARTAVENGDLLTMVWMPLVPLLLIWPVRRWQAV